MIVDDWIDHVKYGKHPQCENNKLRGRPSAKNFIDCRCDHIIRIGCVVRIVESVQTVIMVEPGMVDWLIR